ncbi:MAG: T9SS type A sorting domain-containing protein, partial [Candidatus Eisenbacteria bacterium]|nr:T9SS type A sorting domain-containing protein [Candidatus Eisenbacteria bacterium]
GSGPHSVALSAPRPNPSRAAVTLSFSAPPGAQGRLEIFDVRGRRVRTLPVAGGLGASNQIVWDGRGESGRALPAGAYLCRLQAGGTSSTRRVTLLH